MVILKSEHKTTLGSGAATSAHQIGLQRHGTDARAPGASRKIKTPSLSFSAYTFFFLEEVVIFSHH